MTSQKNIMYWNCANGIFTKREIIKNYLTIHEPELFFISEAEIDLYKETNLLQVHNYELYLANTISETRKSRICCYSKSDWSNLSIKSKTDEILAFKKANHIVVGIYRPFKIYSGETTSTNFERLLGSIQEIFNTHANCDFTLVGDFNIDYKKIGD